MKNCASRHSLSNNKYEISSISKELSISDVDYRKSQFRTAAIVDSQAFHFSSEADSDLSERKRPESEIDPPPASPLGGVRLKPVHKRIPCPPALEPKQHMLQVLQRLYLNTSESRDEYPPSTATSPAFFDFIFETDALLTPDSTASSFAPPSHPAILRFCDSLECTLAAHPSRLIALRLPPGDPAALAAGVFLAGAFMLLRIGLAPDEIAPRFAPLAPLLRPPPPPSPPGRGAAAAALPAPEDPDQPVHCTLADCWAGLWKAHRLGWLEPAARPRLDSDPPGGGGDGDSDIPDPFRPDIQVLVPGRLVVLRGPKGLPGGLPWRDVVSGDGRPVGRDFAPAGLAPALRRLGVQAVVRLNAAEYPADAFPAAGLGFADLYIPEGGPPPADVAAKFLRILDAVPGAVAVHGGAGLGRAGALAALYAMRRHGFSAREAAGWLRAVRPGSVAPEQLAYLAGREAVLRRVAAAASAGADAEAGAASPISRVALMLGRPATGSHSDLGLLSPLRSRRTLAPLASAAAGPGGGPGDGDGDGASAADSGRRTALLIAAVMAEVDARLQALEPGGSGGGRDCSEPGSPMGNAGAGTPPEGTSRPRMPRMPRQTGSCSPGLAGGGPGAGRRRERVEQLPVAHRRALSRGG